MHDHWIPRWVERQRWWVKWGFMGGLGVLSAFLPGVVAPQWQVIGVAVGAALFCVACLGATWHGINDFREHHRKQRLRLEPNYLIIFGLAVALIGVGWQSYRSSPKTDVPSGNSLQNAIDTFLAKTGKTANYSAANSNIQMVDSSDGRGPYFGRWDASLDPWPTTSDGFTAHQLLIFPTKRPRFTTQFDKEKFREALERLSDILNKQAGTIFSDSQLLFQHLGPERWRGDLSQPLRQVEKMKATWLVVNELLFTDQNNFLAAYPRYRDELAGILPEDSRTRWQNIHAGLDYFSDGMTLLQGTKNRPDDSGLHDKAAANMVPIEKIYSESVLQSLQWWLWLCNHRLDAMARAI